MNKIIWDTKPYQGLIRFNYFPTPVGSVLAAKSDQGLCFLCFFDNETQGIFALERKFSQAQLMPDSKIKFNIFISAPPYPIHIIGTAFQHKVWQALITVPKGKLCTYGELAAMIKQPTAARAVGTALGQNPIIYFIPCHRVIRHDGSLGGFNCGLHYKKALLALEENYNK